MWMHNDALAEAEQGAYFCKLGYRCISLDRTAILRENFQQDFINANVLNAKLTNSLVID